ncbi:MAG TPA: MlaD family protein [Gemmata sp.]|jgi:paraquat-inducible protein B|nr:MlaD family protein [Gemmata sp.]
MAKRFSPTAIGMFVVGSFALLVAAIVVVGAGKMFQKPVQFVCFFPGDVNGLKVGAPVKFRGVQIGDVASIRLVLPPDQGTVRSDLKGLRLPVVLNIDGSQLRAMGGSGLALAETGFDDFVKRGLRAQLNVESLLTGLLYVDLDLYPKTPIVLSLEPGTSPYREIPTVPTDFQHVQEEAQKALDRISRMDLEGLMKSISGAGDSINSLASSQELKRALISTNDTMMALRHTLGSMQVTLDKVNTKFDGLSVNLEHTSKEAAETLKETREMLLEVQASLDPNSPLWVNLNLALTQFADTADSLGQLSDYLQQNPSALIRGRYVPSDSK